MSTTSDLVGRLAQLYNIVSRPELNGVYILVQAYLLDKNRFLVITLPAPTTNDKAVTIAVKLNSLKLHSQPNFLNKYPHPLEVNIITAGELRRVMHDDGTIIKLSALERSVQKLSLYVLNSHCMLGDKTDLGLNGIPRPTTTIVDNVLIAPFDETSIIEFEDICFVGQDPTITAYIFCVKGHSTTFRRCAFRNVHLKVAGGDPDLTKSVLARVLGDNCYGTPSVVFENCLFEHETFTENSKGVIVSHEGSVTLLNCAFQNCGSSVVARQGGRASLVHCTIENSFVGVELVQKSEGFSMLNCSISNCGLCGIHLDWAGHATIVGCKVEGCRGNAIQALRRSKHASQLHIRNCYIAESHNGISLELGDFDAHISNPTILNNHVNGLFVFPSVMGSAEIRECRILHNKDGDVLNASQARCIVTVDGVEQHPVWMEYEPMSQLYARRCYQKAGLCDILCDHCGKKEETDEKFKKCGKCEDVCYCSRECQKAHWKEHKKVCKPCLSLATSASDIHV